MSQIYNFPSATDFLPVAKLLFRTRRILEHQSWDSCNKTRIFLKTVTYFFHVWHSAPVLDTSQGSSRRRKLQSLKVKGWRTEMASSWWHYVSQPVTIFQFYTSWKCGNLLQEASTSSNLLDIEVNLTGFLINNNRVWIIITTTSLTTIV